MKKIFGLLAAIMLAINVMSQEPIDVREMTRREISKLTYEELLNLSLDDLMYLAEKMGLTVDELLNMHVSVGSQKALTPRETPGIVSVITADEIKKTGARDLIDVLNMVPGISFGHDVDGVVGLAMRGNWGLEGKILVLVDGMEMNEGMYSTVQFGNHFFVDQIERIEIIRGPGSSLYGGYAELGVINIITSDAASINGLSANASYGRMQNAMAREQFGLKTGYTGEKGSISMKANHSLSNRSDAIITDFYGDEYDMSEKYSGCMSDNINLAATSGNLNARFMYDNYRMNITGYDEIEYNRFQGIYGIVDYNIKAGDKLTLTPGFRYKSQLPYNLEDSTWFYQRRFSRYNGNLLASYDLNSKINLSGGVDYYFDHARDLDSDEEAVFINQPVYRGKV